MSKRQIIPTGKEVFFDDNELIVSKTDTHGKITYANSVFIDISGYTEDEIIGLPHSMIRHPEMPRAVFKLLWDTISSGRELFAYVQNMCKNGDHYWVYAHVTPTFDARGNIIGYHSNRRTPERRALEEIKTIYAALHEEEKGHADPRKGLDMSYSLLLNLLEEQKKPYEEFIWSVGA